MTKIELLNLSKKYFQKKCYGREGYGDEKVNQMWNETMGKKYTQNMKKMCRTRVYI